MTKVNEDLKIEIRPIPGRDGIRGFSEEVEYFSKGHVISAFVNPVSLKYETGLDDADLEYLKEKNFPYEVSDTYVKDEAHPFYSSQIAKTELGSSPSFLYPGKNLIDFVKWKYLLVNSYVYNSETEMKSGSKPQATHFIYNVTEEQDIKAAAIERKNKIAKKVDSLSIQRKKDIILLLNNENVETKKSNYITIAIDRILKDPQKTKELELLLSKKVDEITLSAEIKTAILKNVLQKRKQGIFYFETNLGFSEKDVENFLSEPDNQEIYLNIKSKIN